MRSGPEKGKSTPTIIRTIEVHQRLWDGVATVMKADGIKGSRGSDPTGNAARRVWGRVCKEMAERKDQRLVVADLESVAVAWFAVPAPSGAGVIARAHTEARDGGRRLPGDLTAGSLEELHTMMPPECFGW